MSELLISEKTSKALENLMGMFFQMNRILDRAQSQLSVKFVMPNTSRIVHIKWSHAMPLVADKIADYCDERNYAVSYPATTADYTDYSNLTEIFDRALDYMCDIESATKECIDIAREDGDEMTEYFLKEFLYDEIRPYTKLALNFVDYVRMNGDEPYRHMSMDSRIDKFLGEI